MFRFKRSNKENNLDLLHSRLYDEQSFYPAFIADAKRAVGSIIIESPFISYRRLNWLYPTLENSVKRGVKITINTRDPQYHDGYMQMQAAEGIRTLQSIGVEILYTGNLHRKLAIIDRKILWEGSLNILSHRDSCELMRRVKSTDLTKEMIRFTRLGKWYNK